MIFGKKSNDLKGEKSILDGSAISDRQLKAIVKKYIGYVKSTSPNVHCLTNVVTMQDVANMLLVSGGSAIMAQDKKEMEEIVKICQKAGKTSKVIFENCYLTDDEKIKAAEIAKEVKPDFIKTSTGFGTGGATVEDVKLMKSVVGDAVKVKAAGGIRDLKTAMAMIEAGAERLGTSAGVAIVEEYMKQQ